MDSAPAFLSTLSIVAWALSFSLFFAVAAYFFMSSREEQLRSESDRSTLLGVAIPALIIAPLLVAGSYRFMGWSLLFPVGFDREFFSVFAKGAVPGVIILFSSTLLTRIQRCLRLELDTWMNRPAWPFTMSLGLSPRRRFARLIILNAWFEAWRLSLPLFFAELFVLEPLFNAQGIAELVWHAAKVRDLSGFVIGASGFALFSAILAIGFNWFVNRRMRRLATYA